MRYGNVEIKKQTQISDDIKQFSYEICQKHKVIIRYMETDKDHIWKKYPDYLRKHFWKEHTFWTDGYFLIANKEFRLQKHLAVAVLFTIRHWHIGKKYTRNSL